MRKLLIVFSMTIALLLSGSSAYSDSGIQVNLNGIPQSFSAPVVLKDGTTYIPMRDAFNLFGFESTWDQSTRSAIGKNGDFEIRIPVESSEISVSGISQTISSPAFITDDRTYIPLRVLSEIVGVHIQWVPQHQRIEIYTAPIEKEVLVSDPYFREVLLALVGKTTSDTLLKKDLRFVTRLDLQGKNIGSLDGISEMINLQELIASNNKIGSLLPLKSLQNLKKVYLNGNKIKDPQSLRNMNYLEYVDLRDNELGTLSGFETLRNIKTLLISGNNLDPEDGYQPIYYYSSSIMLDVDRAQWTPPKYDTHKIKAEATYNITIIDGIQWVPASAAGVPTITNENMSRVLQNTGQGISSNIQTLSDLVRFLEKWDYSLSDEEKKIADNSVKRIWSYHRSPLSTLEKSGGSRKALAVMTAYLLNTDYQESGFTTMVDEKGHESFVNYIFDGQYFYYFDPYIYLKEQSPKLAEEIGDLTLYMKSPINRGLIHRVKDPMKFLEYYMESTPAAAYNTKVLDGDEAQYPSGIYSSERVFSGNYYFLPTDSSELEKGDTYWKYWETRISLLYDNPDDTLYVKQVINPITDPEWE